MAWVNEGAAVFRTQFSASELQSVRIAQFPRHRKNPTTTPASTMDTQTAVPVPMYNASAVPTPTSSQVSPSANITTPAKPPVIADMIATCMLSLFCAFLLAHLQQRSHKNLSMSLSRHEIDRNRQVIAISIRLHPLLSRLSQRRSWCDGLATVSPHVVFYLFFCSATVRRLWIQHQNLEQAKK